MLIALYFNFYFFKKKFPLPIKKFRFVGIIELLGIFLRVDPFGIIIGSKLWCQGQSSNIPLKFFVGAFWCVAMHREEWTLLRPRFA